ncbi:MAG TPA: peptidoglycan DD-metalloendopeptidase family protein [Nocardioides sp.]|nr:peptidoglycan DD-metalloendopeptidase family protein [Nocardioides sp.]
MSRPHPCLSRFAAPALAGTARRRPIGLVLLVAALTLAGSGAAAARVVPGPASVPPGPASVPPGAGRADDPGTGGHPATRTSVAVPAGPHHGVPAGAWRAAATSGTWPLRPEPAVVRGFAPPPVAWAAGHRGADLLGRPGQQVRAALAGTVTFVGRIAGRGVVVVSHGDTRTTYEPVAASVSRGDAVARGGVLGRLELLGSHCLPRACLHWGLLRGRTYLDPLTLVGRGPVRLVPWGGLPAMTGWVLGSPVGGRR